MTAIEDFKKDRETILVLREEDNKLRWKIDHAVTTSKHSGALRDHDYRDTWDIIHPKSKEPFKAKSHWFKSFGTDEQKKMISERREKIEQSICAEERQRRKEIDKEIKKIYSDYDQLFRGLEYGYSEGYRDDGENDICDLIQVVINVMTLVKQGIKDGMKGVEKALTQLEAEVYKK